MLHFDREQGFILLIVLMIMQLLSSLGLAELLIISHHLRLHRERWRDMQDQLQVESFFQTIEMTLFSDQTVLCIVPTMDSSTLTAQSDEWWMMHACHDAIKPQRGQYVIEVLEEDPCELIDSAVDSSPMIAQYHRVTLMLASNEVGITNYFQAIIAKPIFSHAMCTGEIHRVIPGRKMMRIL